MCSARVRQDRRWSLQGTASHVDGAALQPLHHGDRWVEPSAARKASAGLACLDADTLKTIRVICPDEPSRGCYPVGSCFPTVAAGSSGGKSPWRTSGSMSPPPGQTIVPSSSSMLT